MKKTGLVILLMVVVACTAFAKKSKQKKKSASKNDITSVEMYRTVCFGQCPEYKIDINTNGMATYTGMRFAPDTGIFTKNIGKARAKEIIDQFITYKADTCREMYENRIPDVPGLYMTINYPNRKKMIYNANFGPAFLQQIATSMEEVGKKTDNSWKKIGMPKLP